jgi:phosphohistidine phosphatase
MKTLLLLRHAKSSWSNPALADIDRPLNKRGKRDAPRIGALLREQDLVPNLILSSPAVRARKTAEAVSQTSGYEGEIEIHSDLYPGDTDAYLETLTAIPDQIDNVLLVSHNPALEEFLDALTGESASMPTAALTQVSLPVEKWIDLDDEVEGQLINLWRVRELD